MAIEDQVAESFETLKSLRAVSRATGISMQTVKRMLITRGIYPSEMTKKVARLRLSGCSDEEIMQILGISAKALLNNSPYTKGTYKGSNKSINAVRIAKCRARKKQEDENLAE